MAGFDLSSATVDAIREGWVDLVLDQQPWLQGYLPILQICLTHNYAFAGLHIDTGAGFAHVDNVETLAGAGRPADSLTVDGSRPRII